jgi:hypothetical protein
MGYLHGCPADVEHAWEKAVVDYFYKAVVRVRGTKETVLKDEDKTHHHDYEAKTIPKGN